MTGALVGEITYGRRRDGLVANLEPKDWLMTRNDELLRRAG
jgi:hypothetical protein